MEKRANSHPKYSWGRKVLRRKGKVIVGSDSELRKTIFELFHKKAIGGHSRVHATKSRITSLFIGKGYPRTSKVG